MAICGPSGLAGFVNLDPDCNALNQVGGVNKTLYIGSLDDLASFTQNADGEVITLTMKSTKKMFSVSGKKLKNSASNDAQITEVSRLYGHVVNYLAYVNTQVEKNAIELLGKTEDLFIIVPLNYGRFEVYGLIGDTGVTGQGLSMTALAHNTGTAQTDDTSYTLTFSGAEAKLPVYTKFGANQDAEFTYLDGLLVAAV